MAISTGPTTAKRTTGGEKLQSHDRCILKPSEVTGIILAGEHTWGRGALEDVVCRPLLPIAGRPLIWHIVNWLGQGGVAEAFVCANSNTEALRRSLGDGGALRIPLKYYEDRMPRGPAGCARDAASAGGGRVFVVAEGAIVPKIDLGRLIETHVQSKAALTIAMRTSGPTDDRANAMPEPVGIYVFSPVAFEHVPDSGYQDIKEMLIPSLYACGEPVATYMVPWDSAPRLSGAASYLAVNMWAVERLAEEPGLTNGFVCVDDAWVHESAMVDSTARLVGAVLVGPDSVIGPGAMIIGPTTVGAGCTIEKSTVISRTAVWDRCTVGAGAIVDNAILTDDTCVEPELVVRNTVYLAREGMRRTFFDWLTSYGWVPRGRRRADLELARNDSRERLSTTIRSIGNRRHSPEGG